MAAIIQQRGGPVSVINIELPDSIIESYRQENESIQEGLKNALVVWEYLNGRLSLRECGELLHVGYRGFIELLWSKGISIDGLNDAEFQQQLVSLRAAEDELRINQFYPPKY
ncbi:MAG: hypothetical protein D3904_10420 [Candidatus Electrothrix sp. EH2]|nr:hypothetical protein [Candidatus Electrothrix sp. EH2]